MVTVAAFEMLIILTKVDRLVVCISIVVTELFSVLVRARLRTVNGMEDGMIMEGNWRDIMSVIIGVIKRVVSIVIRMVRSLDTEMITMMDNWFVIIRDSVMLCKESLVMGL